MCTGRWVVRFLGVSCLLLVAGCGAHKSYPVQGMVVYPDGTPMKGGAVMFEPIGAEKASSPGGKEQPIMAQGYIADDGTFALSTFGDEDGAPPGRYRALVRGQVKRHGRGVDENAPDPKWDPLQIHPKYQDFKTSGLEFTVEPKTNEIVIHVERATKPL